MKTLSRTELDRSLREGLRPLYLLLGSEVIYVELRHRRSLRLRSVAPSCASSTNRR
jgi:hypothetical protein